MKINLLFGAALFGAVTFASAADKKIVLIAGRPSHPPGMHEFRAGSLLLKAVERPKETAIDDDLAKKAGLEDLAKLKDAVRRQLAQESAQMTG